MGTQEWPKEFWKCRDLGHGWTWDGKSQFDGDGFEWRTLQCRDCPTTKRQMMLGTGEVAKPRYAYPDGYILHGDERLSRRQIRAIVFRSARGGHRKLKAVR